jgi:hypothetical protein
MNKKVFLLYLYILLFFGFGSCYFLGSTFGVTIPPVFAKAYNIFYYIFFSIIFFVGIMAGDLITLLEKRNQQEALSSFPSFKPIFLALLFIFLYSLSFQL